MLYKPFDANGSAVQQVRQVNGADAMASSGEVTQTANTALVDASYNLTVAHYRLTRELSDLVNITSPDGMDVELLARLAVESATLTLTDMLCALFPSLASSVGTSGVDLSVDDIFSAQFQLQGQNVQGPFNCVLHPVQISDLQSSLRAEQGNALSWDPGTRELIAAKGPGFAGSWNGIDFWKSDSVGTSGGNRRGAMYGMGCFAYTEAPIAKMQAIPGLPVVLQDSRVLVEVQRKADYGSSLLVAHYAPAVSEAEDLRGVYISTDA